MTRSNFNKTPSIKVPDKYASFSGWQSISRRIIKNLEEIEKKKKVLVIECYHGVNKEELINKFIVALHPVLTIHAIEGMKDSDRIEKMVFPDVTDDRIFGFLTKLELDEFFDSNKLKELKSTIDQTKEGLIVILGIGASIVFPNWDLLIYADMPRWEIQQRIRRKEIDSIGLKNKDIDFMRLYKQGYFVDWRICDRQKKKLLKHCDFVLDTTKHGSPQMLEAQTYLQCLDYTVTRPFSVVPFFDPGPWGGQWMKEKCNLDKSQPNFAWCFNCVPEENSLFLQFGEILFETPAINLVFYQPESLLGERVFHRFGMEFPIRFDFLDTIGGGNLSLQVHPLTSYIKKNFGMDYTQDESYYFMDAKEGAVAYLGLKEDVDQNQMLKELREAQDGGAPFHADNYIETWPVKAHDHLLIPAGTIHCQGRDSMVLEISATPYIFTFKLWDWGRLGLDGKPRPINIDRGEEVIKWERDTSWTSENLVNQIERIAESEGWTEEKTGLHELEFIETRRHWFTSKVKHDTKGTVHVINLVKGREAVVESPDAAFDPFVIHYAETMIVPAAVGKYTIRPFGESIGKELATMKAYVRH